MKHKVRKDLVLGVNITAQLIEAVLLQQAGDQVNVLKRIIRQRAKSQEFTTARSLAKALPGLRGSDDADYTLDIGDGGGAATASEVTFLATEFQGLNVGTAAKKTANGSSTETKRSLFVAQLAEILDECSAEGYVAPTIVFCVPAPEVSYTEISSASKTKKDEQEKPEAKLHRKALLDILTEQRTNPFEAERVAFVPLAPAKGRVRYAAIVPEATEGVNGTLEALIRKEHRLPPNRIMDSELSAYARLVRRIVPGDQPQRATAFVRVGTEDTLLLFFKGTELSHFERLRSLSTYDSPETICSRVLLQQDEQRIGDLDHILVLTEGRGEQLINRFKTSFGGAAVETVQEALGALGVTPPRGKEDLSAASVGAIAAGLRVARSWDRVDPGFDVQLLPRKIQKDRKKLSIAWHTALMLLVLVGAGFFFSWRYMDNQAQIDRERRDLELNPIPIPVDNPALLQMRVDSLKQAHARYTHALNVIDSLLIGSDRWTRLHEAVTRSTSTIGGIWLESIEPVGRSSVRINGTATSRTKVAQLARRHQGSVEKASSFDIKANNRPVTLYDFIITAPVAIETPRVALYLQDVAAGLVQDADIDSILATYNTESLYAPGDAARLPDSN